MPTHHVCGYTKTVKGTNRMRLTDGKGRTILETRHTVVRNGYGPDREGLAVVFRLAGGRSVAGYALADDGMLFRGELVAGRDRSGRTSLQVARSVADYYSERDAEDEALADRLDPEDAEDQD